MNNIQIILLALLFSFNVFSGGEKGNGGGAWVCLNNSGDKIRWIKLLDTFEAENEFGYKLISAGLTAKEYKLSVFRKLKRYNGDLFNKLSSLLNEIESNTFFTLSELDIVKDHFYRVRPSRSLCRSGHVKYAQVANMTPDERLLISSELYYHLSARDKAALYIHELVYFYLRVEFGDTHSKRAREIVGALFSELSDDELKKILNRTFINIDKQSFVLIQKNDFWMGRSLFENVENTSERRYFYSLKEDYEIMVNEVTQGFFYNITRQNPSFYNKLKYCPKTFRKVMPKNALRPITLCPNHPVENVSLEQINYFIKVLNKRSKRFHYRLPTEQEWEYALKKESESIYFFGNDKTLLKEVAIYSLNSNNSTQPVGPYRERSQKKNEFGLYDMLGNVFEWTTIVDINDNIISFIQRGGGYKSSAYSLRSSSRSRFSQEMNFNLKKSDVGFRLVRTLRIKR